jgi:hypothetical protein
MRKAVLLALITTLALGCGSASGGSATGLRGLVKRGPVTPVCRVGVPCSEPARGVKLVFTRSGKIVATATTNRKGWYRVTLPAGRYLVRTNQKGPEFRPQPNKATASAGTVKRRDFYLDTGIR